MESQVSCHEESNLPEDVFIKDVITSETHHVASNQPEKKQTRKWAAWTRQEEESFFNALRQVGKNFEKITFRVQSKNKDQVRHYYYRLVRRMNKLLGPELSLDAKNSKDTNAAMLRWWSLLEKHSCKASKLHLKPRRFKIFLETLENQLLKDRKHQLSKDRKKNATKQASQGENCCIGDLSPVKQTKKRRRSAAYKKWEKAAIAGVSLVADAAAHLEQTALDKFVDSVQEMQGDKVPKDVPPVPAFHQHEKNIQPMTKLKLQLFPVNEGIRRALETENHNPHLELTLSSRKKISSVLEHMNKKWGSCSIAAGELILVPYYAQSLNVMSCHKWSQSSVLSAGDVYAAVGSPPVFRLRYGWFANSVPPQELHKSGGLSVFEWADSLTNVSVSDLLSDNVNPPPGSTQCVAFSCDSFDAAIAAHFSKNVGDKAVQPTVVSSIWGDEETCDAFTFHKNNVREKAETCKEDTAMSLVPSSSAIKKVGETEVEPMNECESDVKPKDSSPKDLHALTDIYWPDSLGGLEVEVGPCRYGSNELILSESLGGLSRILSSSVDAFQNSCFFGTTTLGDHKIDI